MQMAKPLTAQFTSTDLVLSSFYTHIKLNAVKRTLNFESPVKTPLKTMTQILSVHTAESLKGEIKFPSNNTLIF